MSLSICTESIKESQSYKIAFNPTHNFSDIQLSFYLNDRNLEHTFGKLFKFRFSRFNMSG